MTGPPQHSDSRHDAWGPAPLLYWQEPRREEGELKLLIPFVPVLVLLIGFVPIIAVVYWWRRNNRLRKRQYPLTRDLLRPPGHSLRQRIDDLDLDIDLHLIAAMTAPLLLYSLHISQSYFGGEPENGFRIGVSVLTGLIVVGIATKRLIRLLNDRKHATVGLDGELATGEELNQLLLHGCRVFHDIPFRYGNIDHVVVSQSGVYTVNTKMHGKMPQGGGVELTVDNEKNVVRFPDGPCNIPISQLTTEAKWLSDYLTKAVGQPVNAEPILALPGWFIKERIGRGPVYVINPCNPKKFFVQNRQVLSPEMVQRVAHQLEQLCRDVEPAFREKKGWGDD